MRKVTVMILAACMFCTVVQAQQTFAERFNLPKYDCEQKAVREMKKVTIVVPDDSTIVWNNAKWFQSGLKKEVSIKTESQLQKSDLDDNLWIMGPIADYSHWERFDVPVKKLERGFMIEDFSFKDILYGFSYVSPPEISPLRLVSSGNSLEAYKQIAYMLNFGFEYTVIKNAVSEFIGNGSQVADLNVLRESHYTPMESKYYVFMVSKNLNQEEVGKINDVEIEKYDNHADAFVKKMELNLPEKKVKTYIHATQEEIKYLAGFFGALCSDDGTVFGLATGDEIHSWKWEGAIEHEANHHLFNQQINKMAPIFLSEGIQKWYEYTNSEEKKEKGFQKAREFADEDLTDMICGKKNFHQGDKYYLISGIFTDYLIDTYGLDKFKELFRYEIHDILSGFEKTYDKSLSEILEEYKNWLTKSAN